jgi:hypothetical protein
MRKSSFSTVFTARTSSEAQQVIHRLQNRGLHPAELGLTTPCPIPNVEPTFPVAVPADEAEQAKKIVGQY